jgi:ribonuclease HI
MSKNKYYVVWEGHSTGIFSNWNECLKATKGYPGAKFKGFKTLETATKASKESYYKYAGKDVVESELSKDELRLIGKPIEDSISVDAACSGNPGKMEYKGVYTKTKQQIFIQGPFEEATNNIGEFLALVHALAYLKNQKSNLPIYSDSKIAISWINSKQCRTNLERTKNNEKVFELISRAETWLKNNSFTNKIFKWETKAWGEIPADFGRKK